MIDSAFEKFQDNTEILETVEKKNEKVMSELASSSHCLPLEQTNHNQMIQSPNLQTMSCHSNFLLPDDPVVLGKPVEKFIREKIIFS